MLRIDRRRFCVDELAFGSPVRDLGPSRNKCGIRNELDCRPGESM